MATINLPQVMTGFIYWIVGMVTGWLFIYKLGGLIIDKFATTDSSYWIFTSIKWILFLFLAFILPYMMMQDKSAMDKVIKLTGG